MCSIATTKRRRYFWAVWWSGPPTRVPFRKPDASDGGAANREEALASAEARAGMKLLEGDPLWAKAWLRILRGEPAWPSKASREPQTRGARDHVSESRDVSIWARLGVTREVSEEELKAAYRKRALETHPDRGGSDEAFRRVVLAYEEASRRLRRPRARRA